MTSREEVEKEIAQRQEKLRILEMLPDTDQNIPVLTNWQFYNPANSGSHQIWIKMRRGWYRVDNRDPVSYEQMLGAITSTSGAHSLRYLRQNSPQNMTQKLYDQDKEVQKEIQEETQEFCNTQSPRTNEGTYYYCNRKRHGPEMKHLYSTEQQLRGNLTKHVYVDW